MIRELEGKIQTLTDERQRIVQEVQGLQGRIGETDRTYGDKVGRLTRENEALAGEVR